jgi:hypothetical protein
MAKAKNTDDQPAARDREQIKAFSTKLFKDAVDRYALANNLSMSDAVIVLAAQQLGLDSKLCVTKKLPSGRKRRRGWRTNGTSEVGWWTRVLLIGGASDVSGRTVLEILHFLDR